LEEGVWGCASQVSSLFLELLEKEIKIGGEEKNVPNISNKTAVIFKKIVLRWLRYYVISRKVAGSSPDELI
jgi:hypothetical protein